MIGRLGSVRHQADNLLQWLRYGLRRDAVTAEAAARWRAAQGNFDATDTALTPAAARRTLDTVIGAQRTQFPQADRYPWLLQLLCSTLDAPPLHVLDFGGGWGQAYYWYTAFLPTARIADWTVIELESTRRIGEELARERGATNLRFAGDVPADHPCTVFLGLAVLQVAGEPCLEHLARLATRPQHVIFDRLEISQGATDLYSVKRRRGDARGQLFTAYAHDALVARMAALGYRLMHAWQHREAQPILWQAQTIRTVGLRFSQAAP